MLDPFEQRRSQVLQGLESQQVDKSRAGGVDARIQGLVDCMNQHPHLYTTSSCSGITSQHFFVIMAACSRFASYLQPFHMVRLGSNSVLLGKWLI